MEVTTIGLDLAKNVFQVHGVDDEGTVVNRVERRDLNVRFRLTLDVNSMSTNARSYPESRRSRGRH